MCVVLCMGGNSSTWMNTAVLVTCMRNFPRSRGTVTGTLKGYIGLSTAIFTQLCAALFTSSASAFLLLLTFLPALVCLVAMLFLSEVPPSSSHEEDVEEQANFTVLNWISLSLAVYLLTFTLLENFFPLTTLEFKLFAVVLLIFLVAPLGVPFKLMIKAYTEGRLTQSSNSSEAPAADGIKKPLLEEENNEDAEHMGTEYVDDGGEGEIEKEADSADECEDLKEREDSKVSRAPVLGQDHTLSEALVTIDFWLLFFTFLCGIGTGITAINNLGQIGEAQGFTDVSLFISLISIWGFFGRIGAGAISEYYVKYESATPYSS